jgi:hypothetical protein
MSREKIEQVVSEQTGQQVRLEPGAYKSARLEKLREFDDEAERLAGPDETAPATSVRLR